MRVLGVDPSTSTGIVMLDDGKVMAQVISFPSQRGIVRVQSIADAFEGFLASIQGIDCAMVEGYGFASASLHISVEIGVFLRMSLHKRGMPWYICPPTTLKKWVTDKGNSKKPEMASAARNRWGFAAPSDDVVDAFCLAKLAELVATNGVMAAPKGVQRG